MTETQSPSITLTRRIKAPPSKVYAALTKPALMTRWWRPDAGPVLHAEADVRVGGRFRVKFQMRDDSIHDCGGVYLEVEPARRLVFTWMWFSRDDPETLVTIELRAIAEGTGLTLTHTKFTGADVCANYRDGWIGALDKLEALFAPASERIQDGRA